MASAMLAKIRNLRNQCGNLVNSAAYECQLLCASLPVHEEEVLFNMRDKYLELHDTARELDDYLAEKESHVRAFFIFINTDWEAETREMYARRNHLMRCFVALQGAWRDCNEAIRRDSLR